MYNALVYITMYALPAAVVWAILGVILWFLQGVLLGSAFFAVLLYAFVFGLAETAGVPLRTPGATWQVPAQWLKGRPPLLQSLIWGICLGPGLATRNPYAGIWLLPGLLLIFSNSMFSAGILGGLLGLAHGSARAVGVLWNHKRTETTCNPAAILTAQWRWRFLDGLGLLLATGIIIADLLPWR